MTRALRNLLAVAVVGIAAWSSGASAQIDIRSLGGPPGNRYLCRQDCTPCGIAQFP